MSYAGDSIVIPCSAGGFNGSDNKTEVPIYDMVSGTRNLNLYKGGRQKRGGTSHVNGTVIESGARIYGLFDYLKPAGTQYIVFATSGKVYKNATTTIKTGWTASKQVWFNQYGGEVYAFNGSDLPGKWDGTTWTDLTTDVPTDWATSKPKYGITHGRGNQLRHWAFGCASTPYRLYVSPDGDGDDWSNANVTQFDIDTKDGYGLMGGVVVSDQLVMFGKKQAFLVDDRSATASNWGYDEAPWKEGGVAHQRLIIPTPNDVVCVDENMEIYSIMAAQNYGDFEQASIARPSWIHNWIKDNVREAYIADFHGIYDPTLRAIKIFVVRNGETEIDTALVYFIDRGPKAGWMIHDNQNYASGYDASCSAKIYVGAGDYQIYTGDYSGWIWSLETANNHDNSNQYDAGFRTSFLGDTNTKWRRGKITCDPQGTETINVAVYADETQIDAPSAWANATAYAVGDVVSQGAKIYECIVAHTSATANDKPGSGTNWTTYWVQHRFSMTVASGTKDYFFDIGAKGRLEINPYNNTVSEDMFIEKVTLYGKGVGVIPG